MRLTCVLTVDSSTTSSEAISPFESPFAIRTSTSCSRGVSTSSRARVRSSRLGACAQKVGEEAVELVRAALSESDERVVEEAADLVYHLYVLLAARGVELAAVEDELASRAR